MSLTLILGPMFSGKSSELYRNLSRYEAIGMKVLTVTHQIDVREFGTHDGRDFWKNTKKALYLQHLFDMPEYKEAQVVGIDEGQFFEDLNASVRIMVQHHKKIVVVASLDGDADMKKFGQALDLFPVAEKAMKLHAICTECLKETPGHVNPPAAFTKKLNKTGTVVSVGGSDLYKAVCRNHHH